MVADYDAVKTQISSLLCIFHALDTLQREWLVATELFPQLHRPFSLFPGVRTSVPYIVYP